MPTSNGGMGFRDLQAFNLALLGKQGCRLITRPKSLCARVLKALPFDSKGKNYPHGEFMTATRRKRSLATWRAILDGRVVLQRGLISRVGDGTIIMVWSDNWITTNRSLKPFV